MFDDKIERLADTVNEEPIVYMDCSGPEIMGAFMVSFTVSMVLCIFLGLIFGGFLLGLIAGMFLGLAGTWVLLNILRDIRQKYYPSWLSEKIYLFKQKHGMFSLPFFKKEKAQTIINYSKRFGKGG